MTIDEMIEVLLKYREGEEIQVLVADRWADNPNPTFDFKTNKYRVKPKPMEVYVTMYWDEKTLGTVSHTRDSAEKSLNGCQKGKVVKFNKDLYAL